MTVVRTDASTGYPSITQSVAFRGVIAPIRKAQVIWAGLGVPRVRVRRVSFA